jgi:hypothetical protein
MVSELRWRGRKAVSGAQVRWRWRMASDKPRSRAPQARSWWSAELEFGGEWGLGNDVSGDLWINKTTEHFFWSSSWSEGFEIVGLLVPSRPTATGASRRLDALTLGPLGSWARPQTFIGLSPNLAHSAAHIWTCKNTSEWTQTKVVRPWTMGLMI